MEKNACGICQSSVEKMAEPVTTNCGHMMCWGCIFLVGFEKISISSIFFVAKWVEARKAKLADGLETMEQARRCPACRGKMETLTPVFIGVARSEAEIEYPETIPNRPSEGSKFIDKHKILKS